VEPLNGDDRPHLPPPSLWPVGFAVGVACILVGLIVDPLVVVPIGVAIALVFGFLWARDATKGYRAPVPDLEPEVRRPGRPAPPIPANVGEAAMPLPEPGERFPRSKFLEFSTLGLGGVIGGIVTVPILGPMVANPFRREKHGKLDLGPLSDFPSGQWVIATFMTDPAEGEVTRRTAYIRNNGEANGQPSFTIISNRCAHLGCPVQPNGPVFESKKKVVHGKGAGDVTLIPMLPAGGFGCPCHGGQYNPEGDRTAGPPVRALDRYEYSIIGGHLVLGKTYSVSKVDGTGAQAKIHRYGLANPGNHVDGPEAWLYPLQPPH
jgi:quinol---cytochrome c reductase iron-sulfur subunit, bacillus type